MDPTSAHNRVIPRRARYTVQTKRRVRKRQRPDIRDRVRALVAIRRVVVHDRRRLIYRRDRVVRPVARILSNVNRSIKTTINNIVAFIATKRVSAIPAPDRVITGQSLKTRIIIARARDHVPKW